MSAQTPTTQQVTLEAASRPEWARGFDSVAIRGTRNAKKIHAPDLASGEPESLCRTTGSWKPCELETNWPFRPLCKCAECQAYWDEQGVSVDE